MFWQKRGIPVLQLEVSGHCQLKCVFCPHTILAGKWRGGLFPWEKFQRYITPYFKKIGLVYFQGWGEPLLHPRLLDMLQAAKEAGCRVGFTTNGVLLNPEIVAKIISLPCDVIGISLAGATENTHDSLRRGSSLKHILSHVSHLTLAKKEAGSSSPKILLAYLMMKANIGELPEFIDVAAATGVDEVVATNLDLTLTPEMEQKRIFSCEEAVPDWSELVSQAKERADARGLAFRVYPLTFNYDIMVCDARPLSDVFINSRGEVSPCVYLGLPCDGVIPRFFCGRVSPIHSYSYGSVEEGLFRVLKSRAARTFKGMLQKRAALANPVLLLDNQDPPPPPEPCQHCYKLYGI